MGDNVLTKLSYGMYVVTSGQAKCNGQIANTVFQVTSQPETVAVSINKQNFTHELIKQTGVFAVSVLSKNASLKIIGNFGFRCGRDVDKFAGIKYKVGVTGTQIVLDNAIAYFEAQVIKEVDMGTHTLFIGKVVNSELLNDEEPMTYEFYRETRKGATPETAPTYVKKDVTEAESR